MSRPARTREKMTMQSKPRNTDRSVRLGWLVVLALAVIGLVPGTAAADPIMDVKTIWSDTNLPPGGEAKITVQVRNLGDAEANDSVVIEDQLPAGIEEVETIRLTVAQENDFAEILCSKEEPVGGPITVRCEVPGFFAGFLFPAPGVQAGQLSLLPTSYVFLRLKVAVAPGASGTGTNTATVEGGGSQPASDISEMPFDATPAEFGLVPGSFGADVFDAAYPGGEPVRQAGDRPFEQRVDFDLNLATIPSSAFGVWDDTRSDVHGLLENVEATLPRGMVGNPEATPKCDPALFAEQGAMGNGTACPSNTQVGYLNITARIFGADIPSENLSRVPIYNVEPPRGTPADFAFNAGNYVQAHIYFSLDPAQNYAIKSVTPNISNFVPVAGSEVTIWGVPGDPAHDFFRFYPELQENGDVAGAPFGGAEIRPLATNPTDCGFDNGGARIRVRSYTDPSNYTPIEEYGDPLNVTGCDDPRFRFEPDINLQPTSRAAGGPTGLEVHLEVPQRDDSVKDANELYAENGDVQAIPTPPMKKAVVTFPKGMTLNPAAAQGLGYCSPEQIGLGTDKPVTCPDNSQYGTLTLHTPVLPIDAQPEGWIYIAKQNDNPFHNFLSLYLVIDEPERGILIKVPGRADLDPQTGQITTTFDDLPQFPLEDMEMNLKGGLRAGLVNPPTCGKKTIEATFYSWHEPNVPKTVNSNYVITQNPDGSPCRNSLADRPFEPFLSGGTVNNLAGSFSPLEITMTRSDEDQELSGIEGVAPPGLLASLKGVGRCTDAAIAAAAVEGRSGIEEQNNPSCPASSLVGTVDAGTGVGQVLTYVKGKVYMAGPYKGAPLSGVAIVPAVAGPFDLGVIVSRAPAYADPRTAEIKLVTDPLPLIFKGIPVRVRDIRVHLDRPNFTLNPTNCNPFRLEGTLFSSEGKSKVGGSPFQAAECSSLGFRPRLTASLFGGTKRGSHPKFKATFKAREGDANVSEAVVTLPRSAFLDQSHIRTVCTRVQFRAKACPSAAIYGHAEATTPLLEQPLRGPVYLRSSDNKLPDIVADLRGEIPVEVVGRVDSIRGGIRATFEAVPDAPVESFAIAMQGGKKGLLVNSRDICSRTYRLSAAFTAQNGKQKVLRPALKANCKKRAKKSARPKR